MLTADGRQHVNWGGEPARQRSNQSIAVSLLFIANFKSFKSFPILAKSLEVLLRVPEAFFSSRFFLRAIESFVISESLPLAS